MGQYLLEVNMEHLKDHSDYKYNKPRKINTKYSLFGKKKSKKEKDDDTHKVLHVDEVKKFTNDFIAKRIKKLS